MKADGAGERDEGAGPALAGGGAGGRGIAEKWAPPQQLEDGHYGWAQRESRGVGWGCGSQKTGGRGLSDNGEGWRFQKPQVGRGG